MEELDFLKKHWNKEESFPKINKEEIRLMLHKSSSSIVKWILIICSIEFLLGLTLKAFYFLVENEKTKPYEISLEVISTIATGFILIIFFKEYRKIKTFTNTRSLMNSILKTRFWVKIYIIITLGIIAIQWIWGIIDKTLFEEFKADYLKRHAQDFNMQTSTFPDVMIFTIFLITFTIISLLLFLYYRFVYIRLIKKLKKNYNELISLEE